MVQALWKGKVIAESDRCVALEGNFYFPPEDIHQEYLVSSNTHTLCSWKGRANYYSLQIEGETNRDAAWYYPEPTLDAKQIRNHVAFWRGVEIKE